MKYTFKGKITLTANIINEQHIKISVEDTGIGIKQIDFKNIFKLFSITEESLEINKSSSHGFGLYISKELSLKLSPNDN